MVLALKDKHLPLKAFPEKELDKLLETQFLYFVSKLLNLKPDKERAAKEALPAVKKHFKSLGMSEVVRAFEMYADSKLTLEPKSGYFDRVLVGQVFKAYKNQDIETPRPPDREKQDQEKQDQDMLYVIQLFDFFIQDRYIPDASVWVYDYLEEKKGLIDYSKKEKNAVFKITGSKTKTKCKLIQRYFEQLEAKEQHIKDLI